jgi:hypothetical protein
MSSVGPSSSAQRMTENEEIFIASLWADGAPRAYALQHFDVQDWEEATHLAKKWAKEVISSSGINIGPIMLCLAHGRESRSRTFAAHELPSLISHAI